MNRCGPTPLFFDGIGLLLCNPGQDGAQQFAAFRQSKQFALAEDLSIGGAICRGFHFAGKRQRLSEMPRFTYSSSFMPERIGAPNAGIEKLPLPDETVDVVISNGVFNLCPDKPRVLVEAFRVFRPGGRLQMADILLEEGVTPEEVAKKRFLVGLNRRSHLGAVAPEHAGGSRVCRCENARLDRLSHVVLHARGAHHGQETNRHSRITTTPRLIAVIGCSPSTIIESRANKSRTFSLISSRTI